MAFWFLRAFWWALCACCFKKPAIFAFVASSCLCYVPCRTHTPPLPPYLSTTRPFWFIAYYTYLSTYRTCLGISFFPVPHSVSFHSLYYHFCPTPLSCTILCPYPTHTCYPLQIFPRLLCPHLLTYLLGHVAFACIWRPRSSAQFSL